MSESHHGPGWAGYAWLTLFCVTAILGGSFVFSEGRGGGDLLRGFGGKSLEQVDGTAPQGNPQQEIVVQVKIRGYDRVPIAKIIRHIRTREHRPYNADTVEEDVRRLYQTRMFTDVHVSTEKVQGGRIVIFEVHERPTLEAVKYVGNHDYKRKRLAKETGLKPGDPADPYALEEARRKLEEFYHSKGYSKVQISILEGTRQSDRRAIFLIDEGPKERHEWTSFIGNTIATDGRLRTQIKSRPTIPFLPGKLIPFGGSVDPKQIEEDINRLTAYYRSLGFFDARVGRELHWDEDHKWLRLTFVIDEGPRAVVHNVSVIGNKKISTKDLTADLKLKPGRYFSQDEMNADKAKMTDIYGAVGYVFVQVEPEPRIPEDARSVDLVYNIKEGPRCRVGRIDYQIKGDNPHTRWSTIANRTTVYPGQIADIREIRASERRVMASNLFAVDRSKGQAPKLTFKQPGGDNQETDVAAQPQQQPRSRFRGQSPDPDAPPREPIHRFQDAGWDEGGGSAVPQLPYSNAPPRAPLQTLDSGLDRSTPSGMFAGPAAGPAPANPYPGPPAMAQPGFGAGFTPGSPAPQSLLNLPPPPLLTDTNPPTAPPAGPPAGTQSNFWAGGEGWSGPGPTDPLNRQAFDAMSPLTGQQPFEEPPIDLPMKFITDETTTGRFIFSVGVTSDVGLMGSIILDEQNFDWTRWPTSWEDFLEGKAFRGGGERLRLQASPGWYFQQYTASFTEPYLFDTPISLGLSGYYTDMWYLDQWTERRIGGRISLGYQFRPDLWGTIAYRGESVELFNPQVGLSGTVPLPIQAALGAHSLHSFRTELTYDTRDNQFLPTEGWLLQGGFEEVLGSFVFPRGDIDIRKYFLLSQRPDGSGRHVLSLSTHMGITGDNTPVYENYYAGGITTIRGFWYRDASPLNDGVVVGGHYILLNSAEYLFPITADDTLRGVVFCDTGTVEPSIRNWTDKYRVAPGFGVRITIPAMGPAPIALDFAFPVVRNPGDREEIFSFFVGFLR